MCGAALAALIICLQAWRSPFPYRIGDFADHGIVARVDFRRIDWFKTDRARSDAEAQTPHVFRNDPKPLTLLPARFRANLREIANAKSLTDVSPTTRIAFGLTQDSRGGRANPNGLSAAEEFQILHRIVTDKAEAADNRIDDLVKEFSSLIAPIENRGLADVNEFTLNKIRPDQSLAISTVPAALRSRLSFRRRAALRTLETDRMLGRAWRQCPLWTRTAALFERWLVSQAPVTLSYDGAATLAARHELRDKTPNVTLEYPAQHDPRAGAASDRRRTAGRVEGRAR